MIRLALIRSGTLIQTVVAGEGFFLPDGRHVSPAETKWPGIDEFVLTTIADAEPVPAGKRSTGQVAQMVHGAAQWVHSLEDIPPEPMLPMSRQTFFKGALVEFAFTRSELRTLAGDAGAASPPEGMTTDQGRELALIDFDEAQDIDRDHPLTLAIMAEQGVTVAAMDSAWRKWQGPEN